MMITIAGALIVILILAVVSLELYWRWSCLWFYCRRCECFWHLHTLERRGNQPEECEGVCRERRCPFCDKC